MPDKVKHAPATPKRKIIGYLLAPHTQECWMFNGQNNHFPWCLPESKWLTPEGHKKQKYLYVFRCSDTQCTASLGISASDYYRILETALAHLQTKGAPKKKRKIS
jgi:hypothetical protein